MTPKFAVTANHKSLYDAFNIEVKKLGWQLSGNFNSDPALLEKYDLKNCVFYAHDSFEADNNPTFIVCWLGDNVDFLEIPIFSLEKHFELAMTCVKSCKQPEQYISEVGNIKVEYDVDADVVNLYLKGEDDYFMMSVSEAMDTKEALSQLLKQINNNEYKF